MVQAPSDWSNFSALIMLQLIVFAIAARARRIPLATIPKMIAVSMVVGLGAGLFFDLIISNYLSLFSYHIPATSIFLFLNGLLSYGIAVATASVFPPLILPRHRSLRPSYWAAVLLAAIVIFGMTVATIFDDPLSRMFCAGLFVLIAVEVFVALWGRVGPLRMAMSGNVAAFAKLWASSAAVGLIYEIGNFYFPVWRWSLSNILPAWEVEGFIVIFGYVVLFYPLALVWRLVPRKFSGEASNEFVERD